MPILHGNFSGTQFTEVMNQMPKVTWDYTEHGVKAFSTRTLEGGKQMQRTTEVALPTLRVVPNPFVGGYGRVESIGWTLPIDDTHYRIYTAGRVREKGVFLPRGAGARDQPQALAGHDAGGTPRFPGDWEAQIGQGPITFHSDEHLVSSDQGISMLRHLLQRQVNAVARGEDPSGVSFDETAPPVVFEAGNFVVDA